MPCPVLPSVKPALFGSLSPGSPGPSCSRLWFVSIFKAFLTLSPIPNFKRLRLFRLAVLTRQWRHDRRLYRGSYNPFPLKREVVCRLVFGIFCVRTVVLPDSDFADVLNKANRRSSAWISLEALLSPVVE